MIAGIACIFLFLALEANAQSQSFDVKKYGAVADGKTDDRKAIGTAFRQACESKVPSTVTVGKGTYMVGSLTLQGPCTAPSIHLDIQGTILAPVKAEAMKNQDGWIVLANMAGLTVSGGAIFDGQGEAAWAQNDCAKTGKCNTLPINIRFSSLNNSKIEGITSSNSKLFHMNIIGCNNLTLQDITIDAPGKSVNTDGIHIGRSNGVNIIGAKIKTGDDCISLGDGSQQVHIEKVTCGPGHGISVGSLGRYHDEEPVIGILVKNCTIQNTMFGVRIKTWPASPSSTATNMHFEDIAMNNVSTPILIDQTYCPYKECKAGEPSRVVLSDILFKNIVGTSATKMTVQLICSKGVPCKNVELNNINLPYSGPDGPGISECENVQPKLTGKLNPKPCTAAPSKPPKGKAK